MRGLLIYDDVGRNRNEWFISRLIECAKARGCDLELVIYEEGIDNALSPLPDFAIVRTINPNLTARLEELGIPTYNNSATSRIANDKWQTYLLAKKLGIEVMDTMQTDSVSSDRITYPKVLKTVDGHGGSEVFLVKSAEEYAEKLTRLSGKTTIVQEMCDEPGVDMRVYVMGDRILAPVERTSDNDFRSNFSLGGDVKMGKTTDKIHKIITKLRHALGFDFVGVDFIRHDGGWILNEIEDVVGTRMLYSITDIDAADEYIAYVIDKVKIATFS